MHEDLRDAEQKRQDELIALVSDGEMSPEEAEREAAERGWPPFAREPELPRFDPMQQSHWPIVMAVAWIAWRDLKLVRECCPEFRAGRTWWRPKDCIEPNQDNSAKQVGWSLEFGPAVTVDRLYGAETRRKANGLLPPTTQMQVRTARDALWLALGDGKLVAEALGPEGRPDDVPRREWSYLQLGEDNGRDILLYNSLDRAPYTDVRFDRDAILQLWPDVSTYDATNPANEFESCMIQQIASPGDAGLVSFCSALLWIMTDRGTRTVKLDDDVAWARAVNKFIPLIQSGEIALNGLSAGGPLAGIIPAPGLAIIKVPPLSSVSVSDALLDAAPHIVCSPFIDEVHWAKGGNDRLYARGQANPQWTHLQVKKADILVRWPRPESKLKPERACQEWLIKQMRQSPAQKPKAKSEYQVEAKALIPGLKDRQFQRAWDWAIKESGATQWANAGRIKKSNHRTG